MPAGDGVTLPAEVFGQFAFHGDRRLEWHWVEDFVEFRQKADAKEFNHAGGFQPAFMILEALLGRKAGHADVNAGLRGVAVWVGPPNFREPGRRWFEQDHIHVMMVRRWFGRFDLAKGAASQA